MSRCCLTFSSQQRLLHMKLPEASQVKFLPHFLFPLSRRAVVHAEQQQQQENKHGEKSLRRPPAGRSEPSSSRPALPLPASPPSVLITSCFYLCAEKRRHGQTLLYLQLSIRRWHTCCTAPPLCCSKRFS